MAVAPSFQDFFNVGSAELVSRRADLQVLEGDITDAQLHASAAMADAVTRFGAASFRDTFLDGARGDALTELVDDRYNLQRFEAANATVTVRFERPESGGVEPAGTVPIGTIVATEFDASGLEIRFVTIADVNFAADDLGPHDVGATASVAERAGNVAAATIVRIPDPLFDTSITVTNPATAAQGADEETDEELRRRARLYFLTLRGGTLDALEFGALQVNGVKVATAVEDVNGIVTVHVADVDGASSAQMIDDVTANLENFRCAGTIVNVSGGETLTQTVTVALTLKAGADINELAPVVQDAIEGRMAKLGAGETLYRSVLAQVSINVNPDLILNADITTPAADVTPPQAFDVIRAGTITVVEA